MQEYKLKFSEWCFWAYKTGRLTDIRFHQRASNIRAVSKQKNGIAGEVPIKAYNEVPN